MRLRSLVALAAGAAMLVATTATAAVPVPRPGCFLVSDPKGDHTQWSNTKPVRDYILDPAYDLTGLNIGMTAKSLTVYVSVAKLAARPTYGADGWYETSLSVGPMLLSMWVDAWGPLQPVREAFPVADLPVVERASGDQPIRRIRKANGAEARHSSVPYGGDSIPVVTSLDLTRNYITWTFQRSALEKAFKKKLTKGLVVLVGTTASANNFGGLQRIDQDEMNTAVYRVGAKGCV